MEQLKTNELATTAVDKAEDGDSSAKLAVLGPLGSLASGLADGISIKHGIDALRISDTGGVVSADMQRTEVFDQADRVEAKETLGVLNSLEAMQRRRDSYLEFLGMDSKEIEESKPFLDHFRLNANGDDALEHILFGDTRYEQFGNIGVLEPAGLHFLPAAKKIGQTVEIVKDKSKDLSSAQRERGVRSVRLSTDGTVKANPASLFPEEKQTENGVEETTVSDILGYIKYAYENAQVSRQSDFKPENTVLTYTAPDNEPNIPSMRIVIEENGKIVSAFPNRK